MEIFDTGEMEKKRVVAKNCNCEDIETKIETIETQITNRKNLIQTIITKVKEKRMETINKDRIEKQAQIQISSLLPKLDFYKKMQEETCLESQDDY